MKKLILLLITALLLSSAGNGQKPSEIIACGDDQVIVIDKTASDKDNIKIVWRWKTSEATGLPTAYQKYMGTTDDCKPVDKNRKILITSSAGGVVLVDRKTKKCHFYAHVPNAHSAELLPGNRIVVALSTAAGGNCLELFDISKPEKVLYRDSLYSGHGAVWIREIKSFFALGYNELRRYTLKNWDTEKPELQLEQTWKLPDNGGHDLSRVSADKLLLTTTNNVWEFNITNEQFSAFEMLKEVRNVKSVNYNESSG